MMPDRSYSQFCPMARALDVVGDRWTLLIIRELLIGPRRYADLQAALPALSNNLLTIRLKELEAAGVIVRQRLGPPIARQVYVLAADGLELEPVLEALALWGVRRLGFPQPGEYFPAESPIIVLRALLSREHPEKSAVAFSLGLGAIVARISPAGGAWSANLDRTGAPPDASLPLPALAGIAAGTSTWDAVLASGAMADAHGSPLAGDVAENIRMAFRDRPH